MELIERKTGFSLFTDSITLELVQKTIAQAHSSQVNRLSFTQKLEEIINSAPKNCLPIGIGLYILGRNKEAVIYLEKAANSKEKFIFLAFALRHLGKYDEAVESLKNSLKCGADKFMISMEKVKTLRWARNFDAAQKELQNSANMENVSAEYHYQLGYLLEVQGLYQKAAQNYKKAIELSPDHLKATFRLAYRADLSGDEDAAVDYYKLLISKSPVHINALLNLAVIYEDMEKFDKAYQCIEKVLEHHPNHQRALLFRKDILSSKTMFYDEEKEKKKDYKTKILDTPISDFELSVRSRNCFKKMNINTLGDLMNISEAELLAYKNFGETSLKEIKIILESKGLQLGVTLNEKETVDPSITDDAIASEQEQGLLSKSVDDLRLSVRARKCLQKLNLHTLGEVVRKTEAELLGCKNFGVTSLNEIKKALSNIGLALRTLD